MKNIEKWLVAAVCAILIVALSQYFYQTTVLKHLDSVFLFESSQSVVDNYQATSRSVASWPDLLKILSEPVETLCRSSLKTTTLHAYNVFDNHAYTALYPISILTALTGSELAFAILNALAHVLLLILPFIFLRRHGVGILPSLAFALSVALYPAWSYSAIGNYYMDRLYMPFALLSLYFMHCIVHGNQERVNRRLLVGFAISTIMAALFTERAVIMMTCAILFYMLFFPEVRKVREVRNTMLALLALFATYLFTYYKFVFIGFPGGSGIINPLRILHAPGLLPFILVNLLFIGIFVPFSGTRYVVLYIGALLPNLLMDIGGAELNGWATHYHTMYLPFSVFVASIGYLHLARRFNIGIARFALPLSIAAYVLLIGAILNPSTGKFEEKFLVPVKNSIVGKVSGYYLKPRDSYERIAPNFVRTLDKLIPEGAKVSAVEGAMPALYRSRYLSLYPMNMDSADYLVLSGTANNDQVTSLSGAISYLGQAQTEALNQCLSERITRQGFTLLEAIPPIGLLVFKRM